MRGINEFTPMTRRYPDLPGKVLRRDSEIAKKLINASDNDELIRIFLKEQNNLSDQRYWEILRSVWVSAGASDKLDIFLPLFKSNRKHKYYFSTPEEAARLRLMPKTLTVFRAINHDQKNISWTINKAVAEKFKSLYNKDFIEEIVIDKSSVFAFIERRGEEEILIIN